MIIDLCRKLFTGRGGSITIIVAAAMVALVGFCSLVVDMGNLFLTRQRLGNALDAAVLAGCQQLPGDPDYATVLAREYFEKNGMDGFSLAGITISDRDREMTASGSTTVKHFLAGLLGINSSVVSATATARIDPVSGITGVIPVGLEKPPPNNPLQFGVEYLLKEGSSSYSDWASFLGQGNTGFLGLGVLDDDDEKNKTQWEQYFAYGYQNRLEVGDTIALLPGVSTGHVRKAYDLKVDSGARCHCDYPEHLDPSCPWAVIVPVYERLTEEGRDQEAVIVGFAKIHLDPQKPAGGGQESIIRGVFLEDLAEGETDPAADLEYGVYRVHLTN